MVLAESLQNHFDVHEDPTSVDTDENHAMNQDTSINRRFSLMSSDYRVTCCRLPLLYDLYSHTEAPVQCLGRLVEHTAHQNIKHSSMLATTFSWNM